MMRFLLMKPRRVDVAREEEVKEEEEEATAGEDGISNESEGQYLLLQRQRKPSHTISKKNPQHTSSSSSSSTVWSLSSDHSKQASIASQIVTLKASIHCQGCARKVKKVVSKLEGVNTFHIDMKEHKVTVIGNVYPNEVLECVNKVIKGVEFWESAIKPQALSSNLP